eukprot:gene5803-3103_t
MKANTSRKSDGSHWGLQWAQEEEHEDALGGELQQRLRVELGADLVPHAWRACGGGEQQASHRDGADQED